LITRKADLAEEAVASWRSPFSDGWEDWRPDPDWKVPPLPEGICWEFDLTPAHDPTTPEGPDGVTTSSSASP
jgi:hypothetical protein